MISTFESYSINSLKTIGLKERKINKTWQSEKDRKHAHMREKLELLNSNGKSNHPVEFNKC